MTRDTPAVLLGTSELRDMSLAPSVVLEAHVTISHPQLRDLILPLRRGHVLYPYRSAIYEQRWNSGEDTPTPGGGVGIGGIGGEVKRTASSVQELFKLSFTPTCITTNGAIFACGGQKAELFMCDLPQDGPFRRTPPVRPFELNMRLPSGWINNAIAILPTWPNGWAERQAEGQRAHAGYERNLDEPCEACDSDGSDDSDMDDENDEESEYEIVDYDEVQSPAVATYPNSMPFGHAARMGAGGRRDPQYITSRRGSTHSRSTCSATSARKARIDMPRILVSNNDKTVKMFSLRPIVDALRTGSEWEPPATATATSTSSASAAMPALSAMRHTQANLPPSFTPAGIAQWGLSNLTSSEGLITEAASFPTLTGPHRQGRNISANATGRPIDIDEMISARRRPGSVPSGSGSGSASGPASRPASAAPEQLTLRGSRYLGESASEYRARNPAGDGEETARIRRNMELRQERAAERQRHAGLLHEGSEPRKLSLVGGTRFKVPVNHASLSPDLRTMVTVGDSADVYLYEVIDGGRKFRKIGVYTAATDWCFSTSWSKDGRKFAVASQDGQVTIWDHRSSRPLAIFYSRPSKDTHQDDGGLASHHLHQDEVTSSSGREAARVVKFSPEGSSRDLLVFSEENTNIHIIDARTFDTHVVIPVPKEVPGVPPSARHTGIDSVHYGISGIAFDPSGDWLYAGTERTVVEWDLRRCGGGEGGTWSMA